MNLYPSSHQALSPGNAILLQKVNFVDKERVVYNHPPSLSRNFTVLILAQLFAVMPIFGIRTMHASGLKFNWINYRMLYCVSVMSGVSLLVILSILRAASSDLSMKRIGNCTPLLSFTICKSKTISEPIIWFLSKLVILMYFTNLASKWPDLMQYWQNIEKNVPAYNGNGKRNRKFYREITFYTVTISTVTFGTKKNSN